MVIRQQGGSGLTSKTPAHQKVTIAMDKENVCTVIGEVAQGCDYLSGQLARVVVTNPGFCQITEDIECLGMAGLLLKKVEKRPANGRAIFGQVQV
jgi:hypothetical protein